MRGAPVSVCRAAGHASRDAELRRVRAEITRLEAEIAREEYRQSVVQRAARRVLTATGGLPAVERAAAVLVADLPPGTPLPLPDADAALTAVRAAGLPPVGPRVERALAAVCAALGDYLEHGTCAAETRVWAAVRRTERVARIEGVG